MKVEDAKKVLIALIYLQRLIAGGKRMPNEGQLAQEATDIMLRSIVEWEWEEDSANTT